MLQAKDAAVGEGQTWQRRIASLSGHLTGALSNAFSSSETATAQARSTFFLQTTCRTSMDSTKIFQAHLLRVVHFQRSTAQQFC